MAGQWEAMAAEEAAWLPEPAVGDAADCAAERVTYWAAGVMVRGWVSTCWGRASVCAALRRAPTQG